MACPIHLGEIKSVPSFTRDTAYYPAFARKDPDQVKDRMQRA
jgi:hypothetical protein